VPDAPTASEPLQLLAVNIQVLRARGNWSTRALAEHSKVARATVQRVESCDFETVSLDTVDRLARGLGVRTGSLLGRRPVARREADRLVEVVLAENLVRARTHRGWTQEVLTEKSGVSRPVIARIESQARKPDLLTLERLATALGVTVERLLTEPRSKR
jgi:transcriptional regulator with XRE-family HTH domain